MAVGVAFHGVMIGAVSALAAVVVGGIPVAFAALRKVLVEGRGDVPLMFCVPLLCLAAFVGYTLLIVGVVYPALGHPAVHDPVNVALFLSLVGAFLLAAGASVRAVSAASRRAEVGGRPIRFTLYPATVAALVAAVRGLRARRPPEHPGCSLS